MYEKFNSDIDIDVADRDAVLEHLQHTAASMTNNGISTKHNSGVYFTNIPEDPITGRSTIDYNEAEARGYIKIDILNNSVYTLVRDSAHLDNLMEDTPKWEKLRDRDFFTKLVHIGAHYELMLAMPEPIDSITRMAMFLAIIRPGKRFLAGRTWKDVASYVWEKSDDGSYVFKKAHGIAYSHLVAIHMNLLCT